MAPQPAHHREHLAVRHPELEGGGEPPIGDARGWPVGRSDRRAEEPCGLCTGSPLDRPASRGRHTWAEADQDGPLAERAGRRRRLWARAQRDLRAYAEGRGNQGEEQRKAPASQVMPAASARAAVAIHVS
jgi:hypothetical protein